MLRLFVNGRPKLPHHFPKVYPHLGRGGVTLLELLVVVSLIAALTLAVFAAFSGIGAGSRLNSAGNSVANLALLARQNSLAKNAMTALIMIGNAGTEGDYRAFGLFEIVPREDGEPAGSADWSQLGKWETMPEGVTADDCSFAESGDTAAPMSPPLPTLLYHGATVAMYQYVVFRPNGSLLRSEPACVRLVNGFRPPGTQAVTYTAGRGTAGGAANYYRVWLVAATGRIKIDRP